jgi:hypothetical protein
LDEILGENVTKWMKSFHCTTNENMDAKDEKNEIINSSIV